MAYVARYFIASPAFKTYVEAFNTCFNIIQFNFDYGELTRAPFGNRIVPPLYCLPD